MKKIALSLVLFLFSLASVWAYYNPVKQDNILLDKFRVALSTLAEKNPEKIEFVSQRVDLALGKAGENTRIHYLLSEIREIVDTQMFKLQLNNSEILSNLLEDNDLDTKQEDASIKEVSLNEAFIFWDIEYTILEVQKVDSFPLIFQEPVENFSQENPEYREVVKYWKPKQNSFIVVKFEAKNLTYQKDVLNQDYPLITSFIITTQNETYNEDRTTTINIAGNNSYDDLKDYSWGLSISDERKSVKIFDVGDIDFSDAYLEIGSMSKNSEVIRFSLSQIK